MRKSKFILCVQGEGRGHLTQAIAVCELLRENGHIVSCVTVGTSSERELPDFFIRKINLPIIRLISPNFIKDEKKRSVRLVRSITTNIMMAGEFRKSLKILRQIIEDYNPDVLINFYEPLVGAYALLNKPDFKIISIAHQYTYLHPSYRFPPGFRVQSFFTRLYTNLTVKGSKKILAISIREMPEAPNKKLQVVPPILRKELFQQQVELEDFILVYLLNCGYITDILKWHKKHPTTTLYCFTDSEEVKKEHKGEWKIDDNLIFYSLNDHNFLALMARCRGLVCNAGFESVCEAIYLNKPVMLVPVKGHFEQFCNAKDAIKNGSGISSEEFNLGKMKHHLMFHRSANNQSYHDWVNRMEEIVLTAITSVLPKEKPSQPSKKLPENPTVLQ
jgi:uncharacterized protein (TIGR00661 family)